MRHYPGLFVWITWMHIAWETILYSSNIDCWFTLLWRGRPWNVSWFFKKFFRFAFKIPLIYLRQKKRTFHGKCWKHIFDFPVNVLTINAQFKSAYSIIVRLYSLCINVTFFSYRKVWYRDKIDTFKLISNIHIFFFFFKSNRIMQLLSIFDLNKIDQPFTLIAYYVIHLKNCKLDTMKTMFKWSRFMRNGFVKKKCTMKVR